MSKPKILLVDDVNLILELEKSFLRYSPVRIFTARDGEEALAAVKRERPNLIFMDLNMPKMDGPTCCATLKADPEFRSIPVIMVTTAGKEEDEALCRQAGCDDYLTKPIDRRIFLEKGRRFLPYIDRRELRAPCRTQVSFQRGDEARVGISEDISVGGIYVVADGTPEAESRLFLSFVLPDAIGTPIEAKGRVAWENGSDKRKKPQLPSGFGVEFTDIEEDAVGFIRAFVEGTKFKP
ncbi:MAG: response regulator [Geobacteraceae bacterium]|nr:MAG: response regulator [Geobacteraceae bacterium]